MKNGFSFTNTHIFYTDSRPGENATLHDLGIVPKGATPDGKGCAPDGDLMRFNDSVPLYTWAFRLWEPPVEGQRFVFSTRDRAVHAVVCRGTIEIETPEPGQCRILVGAGSDSAVWSAAGWICNDLESAAAIFPNIAIVGPCWALPVADNSADEIMARGMVEHLTYHEVAQSLREWARVLKPGGFITFDVPDVDEYIREYLKMRSGENPERGEGASFAGGEPDDNEACFGIDRWLRRALYGWQRWPGDEHRSGWTEALVRFYVRKNFSTSLELRRMAISFDRDDPQARVRNIWARAWKQ
ncbi:MAG: methyltransferase domain-containing protein [Salinibacterium sp.]|nr:MAG: methyltransferase domain-containing protein [Salinibacterium sp.]